MKISILGCGWLGFPLAYLLAKDGWEVLGSVTNPDKFATLVKAGIQPFEIRFTPLLSTPIHQQFWQTDCLVVNIPPSRFSDGTQDFHVRQVQTILALAKQFQVPTLLYVSSTSVYPENNNVVNEETLITAENTTHYAIWQAENMIQEAYPNTSTIIRMGGLMGKNRIPGKYFAGKKVENSLAPVNYIHQDDAVEILRNILQKQVWGEIFNAVAPLHPMRKDVFIKNCTEMNLPLPEIASYQQTSHFKVVQSDKIQQKIGYRFIYPNPLEFSYEKT